jgi:hypothetical protein
MLDIFNSLSECWMDVSSRSHRCANTAHGELAPNTGMNTGVRYEPFTRCRPEESPMGDLGLVRPTSRIVKGGPGVEVSIEVNDGDGTIDFVERA